MRVRVLEDDERGQRLVEVVGVAEHGPNGVEVHRAVVPRGDGCDRGSGDDGVAGAFVEDRVRLGLGDDLAAACDMGHVRDEVAHRAARDEQAAGFAGQLGRALLERDDRRVVAEDVVADLGLAPSRGASARWGG